MVKTYNILYDFKSSQNVCMIFTCVLHVIYMVFAGCVRRSVTGLPTKPYDLRGFTVGAWRPFKKAGGNGRPTTYRPKVSPIFLKGLQATVAKPCKLHGVSKLARTC